MPTISTTLALKSGPALEALAERAKALNTQVERNENSVTIRGATAHIEARASGDIVAIELSAETDEELLKIRRMLEGFVTPPWADRD